MSEHPHEPLWTRDRDRLLALREVPEVGVEGYALACWQAGYEAGERDPAREALRTLLDVMRSTERAWIGYQVELWRSGDTKTPHGKLYEALVAAVAASNQEARR